MTNVPKYNMAANPVYQVDCSFGASGKTVAATKRRIRFRFGFSNAKALEEGATGTGCRGEEHEVNLTWSLTSGKRIVTADGIEVHYSKGARAETKFETSWTMNGMHTLKLIAHAAPPLRPIPGFRQFDLLLDGLSYFDMPKIYELGTNNQVVAPSTFSGNSFAERPAYNNYNLPAYERQSYYEYERQQPDFARQPYDDPHARVDKRPVVSKESISVQSPTSVLDAPNAVESSPPSPPQDLVSAPTVVQGVDDLIAAPVDESSPPVEVSDEFTPVEPVEQPRSQAVVHNEILSAYGPSPSPANATSGLLALTNGEPTTPAPPVVPTTTPAAYTTPAANAAPIYVSPSNYTTPPPAQNHHQQYYTSTPPAQNHQQQYYTPAPHYHSAPHAPQYEQATPQFASPPPEYTETPVEGAAPSVAVTTPSVGDAPQQQQLTMNQLMDAPLEEEPVDEMDRALKNLVNIDDIATETVAPERKKLDEKREASMSKGKSKPLPPTAPSWHLGLKPALNDIKANAPAREAPKKEIMRPHAFDPRAAQAGMMVLYGSAPMQVSSPGFGVPAQMQQQQQQQYYMYAQQQTYAAY